MANYDLPRVRGARSSRIALNLGQVAELPFEWELPDSKDSGSTVTRTSVQNGESYDPPLVTVQVYAGMRFYDRILGQTLTVEEFRFHVHDSDDSEIDGATWYVDFEEDAPEDAPATDSRWGMNEQRFGKLLLREKIVPASEVENASEQEA